MYVLSLTVSYPIIQKIKWRGEKRWKKMTVRSLSKNVEFLRTLLRLTWSKWARSTMMLQVHYHMPIPTTIHPLDGPVIHLIKTHSHTLHHTLSTIILHPLILHLTHPTHALASGPIVGTSHFCHRTIHHGPPHAPFCSSRYIHHDLVMHPIYCNWKPNSVEY